MAAVLGRLKALEALSDFNLQVPLLAFVCAAAMKQYDSMRLLLG